MSRKGLHLGTDDLTARYCQIMMSAFTHAVREPHEHLKFGIMDQRKPYYWVVKISGLVGDNDEFLGGEYYCELFAPAEYPDKPPVFHFLTPNGVYEVGKDVCVSMGHFHPDKARAAIGMYGFAALITGAGMTIWRDLVGGVNVIPRSTATEYTNTYVEGIRKCALGSKDFNEKHLQKYIDCIDCQYEVCQQVWAETAALVKQRREAEAAAAAAAAAAAVPRKKGFRRPVTDDVAPMSTSVTIETPPVIIETPVTIEAPITIETPPAAEQVDLELAEFAKLIVAGEVAPMVVDQPVRVVAKRPAPRRAAAKKQTVAK